MRDVGNITRVTPDKRVESLMKFRRRLADNPDVSFAIGNIMCRLQYILSIRSKKSCKAGVWILPPMSFASMRVLFLLKRFNKAVIVFQHRKETGVVTFNVGFKRYSAVLPKTSSANFLI